MIGRLSNPKNAVHRLKSLARLEVALTVLVLALATFAYHLYQQAQNAEDSRAAQDRKISTLKDDLIFFQSDNNKEKLREELRELRSTPAPPSLPSEQVALSLGSTITEYAQNQKLPLTGYDRMVFVTTLGEAEFSAVKFTVTAVGNEERLTGMLQLLSDHPTALVQTLEFIRPLVEGEEARDGDWRMKLDVDVIYR